jgi:K+-transporting ATPase KdpF subunit
MNALLLLGGALSLVLLGYLLFALLFPERLS